jgi:hypothetical protein
LAARSKLSERAPRSHQRLHAVQVHQLRCD